VVNSRIDKYRDLRSGLKEEVGINRDNMSDVIDAVVDTDDEDDFLMFVNRLFDKPNEKKEIEDTLTEAKTFEQMRQESSEEIDRALRSAKVSVGKEAQYNTRMDILNKIREPEKQVVRIDNFDNVETSQFSKGYFVKQDKEEIVETPEDVVAKEVKKKMTLMERLASMSPAEDAKKAKDILEEKNDILENKIPKEENQKLTNETDTLQQTASLEDMLRQIKEKDQREVEKVLQQKEADSNIKTIKNETTAQTENKENKIGSRVEVVEEKKNERIVNVLNYIIIFLVVVFIGLCGMIGYQLFF
jgi:predicted RND superfamily exporter protein